jgi:hypothetical protein
MSARPDRRRTVRSIAFTCTCPELSLELCLYPELCPRKLHVRFSQTGHRTGQNYSHDGTVRRIVPSCEQFLEPSGGQSAGLSYRINRVLGTRAYFLKTANFSSVSAPIMLARLSEGADKLLPAALPSLSPTSLHHVHPSRQEYG